MYVGTLNHVSNKATWQDSIEFKDDETDELIDLTEADEITVSIRDQQSTSPRLTISLTDGGVVVPGVGVASFVFTASQMNGLCAGTYDVGVTLQIDDEITQIIIGKLPVLDGVVS